MPEPRILDFSTPADDAITVVFPGGLSRELPSVDEPTLEFITWAQAHAEEWLTLWDKTDQTAKQRTRFGALTMKMLCSLFPDVPESIIAKLQDPRKAKIVLTFTSGSPDLLKAAMEAAGEPGSKKTKRTPTTARS